MLTSDEIRAWLSADSNRIVLFEAEYAYDSTLIYWNTSGVALNDDTTNTMNTSTVDLQIRDIYFSTSPYISDYNVSFTNVSGIGVINIAYNDAIIGIPEISSKIDSSSSLGGIEILNTEGTLDEIIQYAFEGHPFKLLLGDPSWAREDFIQILEGKTEKVIAPNYDTVTFSISDKKALLDVPLQENLLTSTYIDTKLTDSSWGDLPTGSYIIPDGVEGSLVPICLGKCFNIEPVLIDASNHVYLIHEGEIDSVDEVRSNGVALTPGAAPTGQYTVDLTEGLLRLEDNPNETQITCDITGTSTRPAGTNPAIADVDVTDYSIPALIEWVLLNKTVILGTEIDDTAWINFVYKDVQVGYFSRDNVNVYDVCEQLISSVGGFIRFDRIYGVQILTLEDPYSVDAGPLQDQTFLIDEDLTVEFGITLQDIELPYYSVTLGYKKNWTPQDKGSLAGSIADAGGTPSSDLATLYSSEFSKVSDYVAGIKPYYPTVRDTGLTETLIYNKTDAQTELARRIIIRGVKRYIYKIESVVAPFVINVGDTIDIYNGRYGFETDSRGIVVGLTERLVSKQVDLEVWK